MTAHTITTIRVLEPRASATLALTSDAAIEYIIADIPFYCIGLVAFAFFTFMLFMRRVNLLSIYLYTTALFSFVAAVIDLAQILARGSVKSAFLWLRFLFFWAFVAERPRREPPPTTSDLRDPQVYVHYAENFHSAKWERWGYLGILLKWSILASVFSIPVLQIIWRIAEGHYGIVYMVESTIEILVSALFLLKVFLNVFLSPVSPWWKPFQFYAVPLIALLINPGLGIGDLIYYPYGQVRVCHTLFVVEKKPNNIRPTLTTAPEVAEPGTVVNEPRFTYERPTSLAILPRVSSWMSTSRRQIRYYQQNPGDVEAALGPSDSPPVVQQPSWPISLDKDTQGPAQEMDYSDLFVRPRPKPSTESVDYSDLFVRPRPTPPAFPSSVLLPEKDQKRSRAESRISNDVSLRYYGVGGAENSTVSLPNPSFMLVDEGSLKSTGTDSPIYGLDGIMNQQTNRRSALSLLPPPRRPSSTSSPGLIYPAGAWKNIWFKRYSSEDGNPASVAAEPNDARDGSENHEQDTQDEVTTPTQAKQNQYPALRPFFLDNVTTSPMVSSPLAKDARNAAGPSSAPRKPILRGRLALPSNPRPTISGPMQSSLDQSEPSAFESPRPPPKWYAGVCHSEKRSLGNVRERRLLRFRGWEILSQFQQAPLHLTNIFPGTRAQVCVIIRIHHVEGGSKGTQLPTSVKVKGALSTTGTPIELVVPVSQFLRRPLKPPNGDERSSSVLGHPFLHVLAAKTLITEHKDGLHSFPASVATKMQATRD
ncbi:hypothetical protein EV360DRAFT_81641 [Lentinula raphanica]|nr:hypothetical protein EV360DRAFT_81641 [Lentinula raphanica]